MYKIGCYDLIGICRCFTTTRRVDFYYFFPPLAEKEGYQLLLPE